MNVPVRGRARPSCVTSSLRAVTRKRQPFWPVFDPVWPGRVTFRFSRPNFSAPTTHEPLVVGQLKRSRSCVKRGMDQKKGGLSFEKARNAQVDNNNRNQKVGCTDLACARIVLEKVSTRATQRVSHKTLERYNRNEYGAGSTISNQSISLTFLCEAGHNVGDEARDIDLNTIAAAVPFNLSGFLIEIAHRSTCPPLLGSRSLAV